MKPKFTRKVKDSESFFGENQAEISRGPNDLIQKQIQFMRNRLDQEFSHGPVRVIMKDGKFVGAAQ
jgi:hypothetical protein